MKEWVKGDIEEDRISFEEGGLMKYLHQCIGLSFVEHKRYQSNNHQHGEYLDNPERHKNTLQPWRRAHMILSGVSHSSKQLTVQTQS